ncbi:MAG: response regulator transcription factor [Gemmatimonadaceae bacterium]|nr:response regulator transcription factor [Gemmatimonadaceae bacterium]
MPVLPLLLIEDNQDVIAWFRRLLDPSDEEICVASSIRDARAVLGSEPFATIIVDLTLPDGSGVDILPDLRARHPDAGILVFSAHESDDRIVQALEAGADDYVVKPVSPAVLKARLTALRRRLTPASRASTPTTIGDLTCDPIARNITGPVGSVALTPKEWQVLTTLAGHPDKLVPRAELLSLVWGYDFDPHTSVLDVTLTRLRQKLVQASLLVSVHSLRDVGIQLRVSTQTE